MKKMNIIFSTIVYLLTIYEFLLRNSFSNELFIIIPSIFIPLEFIVRNSFFDLLFIIFCSSLERCCRSKKSNNQKNFTNKIKNPKKFSKRKNFKASTRKNRK